jgi:hypothetical protein
MVIGQKKKALLHIAKRDLHLDEESYRQILEAVAGVESATRLDRAGFEKVMGRFQQMGFRGLLSHPGQPVSRGRLIPVGAPQGNEAVTSGQRSFLSHLIETLQWDEGHYQAFCRRIIKKPEPVSKRDGQKIIIGLMAILRHKRREQIRIAGTGRVS